MGKIGAAVSAVGLLGLAACADKAGAPRDLAGADPAEGLRLVRTQGCGACHAIPGVAWPQGRTGGSLAGVGARPMIAGRLPNQPAIMAAFVRDAPSLLPDTGMPPMPLSEAEARDIAAYLIRSMTTETPDMLGGWPPPVLDPAGPFAGPVTVVAWVLFVMGAVVLAVVLIALGVALFGPRKWKRRAGGERLVWIGGLAFPVVVLTGLLIYGLSVTARVSDAPRDGEMRVRVTGEMWWWRVAYLDGQGRETVQDANEVHIPVGRPVVIELESADVIHSLWVPRLGGKTDMIPGRRNFMRLQADKPGVYAGQCAEYCGGPHALMGFVVVAHAEADFEAWRARQAAPAAVSALPGAAVFGASGCGACHTIRGTEANGLAGPDLTHVGSRQTLGAGILPNNQGTMAGWIADSQGIKPGNRMPSYPVLTGRELRDLAAYLDSLK